MANSEYPSRFQPTIGSFELILGLKQLPRQSCYMHQVCATAVDTCVLQRRPYEPQGGGGGRCGEINTHKHLRSLSYEQIRVHRSFAQLFGYPRPIISTPRNILRSHSAVGVAHFGANYAQFRCPHVRTKLIFSNLCFWIASDLEFHSRCI